MFSRRTGVLLLIALACTVVMGVVMRARQARCAETRQSFARRAPIAGASGTNTFVCSAMYEGMPLRDKVIAGMWFLAVLALLRSVLVDKHERRQRRLLEAYEEYPDR